MAAKKFCVVGSFFIRSAAQQSATVQAAEKEALSIGGGQLGPWGVLDGFRLNHKLTSTLSLTHTATSAACNVHLTFHKDRSICLKVNIPINCIFIDANGGNEPPQFPTYLYMSSDHTQAMPCVQIWMASVCAGLRREQIR